MLEPAYPPQMCSEQQIKGPCLNSLHLRDEVITGGKTTGRPSLALRSPWKRARPARDVSTWGHLRHRLGLSVTRSSKRLCEGRRRLLPSILLHGRLNGGLVLRQWNEGRRRKWKLDPTQPQTKSLVQFIKKKKKKKANPCTVFSVAKCTDLIQVCMQVPMVCCALEISVANRVNGLLNWIETFNGPYWFWIRPRRKRWELDKMC